LEELMGSNVKFSEDVVPLGDMKVNPGKIVRRVDETGRPVLLTSHGRGIAVLQALSEYEAAQEERDFMRAVVAGLADVEAGRVVPLADVKRRLGLG
jgi:prevent-host-death family protein